MSVMTSGGAWEPALLLVVDWLNLSILSSNAVVAASAYWWASLAFTSSLLAEMSHLILCGVLSQDGQVSVGSGSLHPLGCLPLLHHRWFFKEATTSLVSSYTCSGQHVKI